MKLYTKRHIFFAAFLTACACFLIGSALFFAGKVLNSLTTGNPARKTGAENVSNDGSAYQSLSNPEDENSFVLQTSEQSAGVLIADKTSLYTQDEVQNISVYDRCNEVVVNINTQVMAVN